eukprot:scaffold7871_cov376-Prasinococcus_capsulatus_cf.AAC.3
MQQAVIVDRFDRRRAREEESGGVWMINPLTRNLRVGPTVVDNASARSRRRACMPPPPGAARHIIVACLPRRAGQRDQ